MFIDDERTEGISERIVQLLRALEIDTMLDVCRRIGQAGKITRTADYQLWRMSQLSMFRGNYEKMIAGVLGLAQSEIDTLYDEVIADGYAMDEGIYREAGASFVAFEENKPLQQLIAAVKEQTEDAIRNITATTGFIDRQTGVQSPLNEYFINVMDRTHLEVSSGSMTYGQAIAKAVRDMALSGMRTDEYGDRWIRYENPGKKPWRNRVEVAARRAVMTGVNQVVGKVSEMNAEKLKTNWFEVSAHPTARPTHLEWQGKVYTREQLSSVCGLGTVTGLQGANCYHHYDAFIPGVSKRRWTDEQLEEMKRNALRKREWNGREYTLYEATQRQRQLETMMRSARNERRMLKEAGADKEDIAAARTRQESLYAEYRAFSRRFDLPEQIDRVNYDSPANGLKTAANVSSRNDGGSEIAGTAEKPSVSIESNVDTPPLLQEPQRQEPQEPQEPVATSIGETWQREHPRDGLVDYFSDPVRLEEGAGKAIADQLGVSEEKGDSYANAVFEFTGGKYAEIRRASRGESDDEHYIDVAERCEEFIRNSPKWAGGELYRGIRVGAKAYNAIMKHIANGDRIDMMGLSSWSSQPGIAHGYATQGKGKYRIVFATNNKEIKTATSIRHLSKFDYENEVLTSGKTVFAPTHVEQRDEFIYIFGDME